MKLCYVISQHYKKTCRLSAAAVANLFAVNGQMVTPDNSTSDGITYVNGASSNYLTSVESANRSQTCPRNGPSRSAASRQHGGYVPELPKIVWHTDPVVKLKLRKRFYPLALTRLTLGADLDVRTRQVSFKWSWKDRIIGGRLEFHGNQIALTKRFNIDDRTKLDLRAAFDVEARRTLFTLNIKPFLGIVANDGPPNGFSFKQKIPLDQHVSLETKGRITVPEARFSNETTSAVSLGEGDFIVDVDELNIRLMLQ